jgi:hypothetical protein
LCLLFLKGLFRTANVHTSDWRTSDLSRTSVLVAV